MLGYGPIEPEEWHGTLGYGQSLAPNQALDLMNADRLPMMLGRGAEDVCARLRQQRSNQPSRCRPSEQAGTMRFSCSYSSAALSDWLTLLESENAVRRRG